MIPSEVVLVPFAVRPFLHFDLDVKRGDELAADHPIVLARPDLFSDRPPARRPKSTAKSTATPKEN